MYNTVMDWSPEVQIEVEEIMFNHNTSSISSDGVNIRKNFSTPFTIPEWTKQGRNDPCCYKISNDITIKARFSLSPSITASARIRAESIDGNGSLGDIQEAEVSFIDGDSAFVEFTVSGITPSTINKTSTDQWQWYFRDIDSGGLLERTSNVSGPHTVYTILDAPQSPMSEPWKVVLDYACDWADGKSSKSAAIGEITEGAYDGLGKEYDGGRTHAGGSTFYLTNFFSHNWADCRDMSAVIHVFSRAIGCSTLECRQIGGPFRTKPIKPIGLGWQQTSWNFHQVAVRYDDYDDDYDDVYDSCIKLWDGDPDEGIISLGLDINGNYKTLLFLPGQPWPYVYWVPDDSFDYEEIY